MEFGLLGPLVVRSDGTLIPVTAGKQRVLLAALLLRANQMVGVDELAHAVWEGCPPGSARVTLQNYVKRLRQVLGPAGHERIVTGPAGYQIEAGPAELDLARFGELTAAGRAAARAGEWPAASAQLGAALALWRGQPLADVPSRTLALTEVPRLAEMRFDAREARIDADLHLGRHAEVIGELQSLVAAEPLRERLQELLMLALFRSGREDEALAAYRRARRQLVEDIGIEPGPGLRSLEQAILRSDPALLGPPVTGPAGEPPRPAASRPPRTPSRLPLPPLSRPPLRRALPPALPVASPAELRPAMLPAGVPGFTGRTEELQALSAMPGSPVVITAIGGTAGVGKTALAVHWARQQAGRFPDGQLYVNLRGFDPSGDPMTPAEALREFLDALQVPAGQIPAGLDGRQALYRRLVNEQNILVLLDNARDPAQVRPLLPGSATAVVLITSRNDLAGLVAADGARPLTLDLLTGADARQLLARRLGPGRVGAEPAAVDELIRRCAGLPLALAITAARAAAHPGFTLAALAAELRDARDRLEPLSTGEEVTDVRAVFSWSYQNLQPPAARMFRLLGLHPGPDITAPAAASLAGLAVPEARRLLAELTRGHLLAEPAPGRYAFHDLLRAYAIELAGGQDADADRSAVRHRMLDHYLGSAYTAALLISPDRPPVTLARVWPGVTPERPADHQAALDWFEAEHHVLLAVVAVAAETGCDVHAWQLAWAMADFLDRRGHWQDSAAIQRSALAAATRLGDTRAQAMTGRALGKACAWLTEYDEARVRLDESLRVYQRLGDRSGQARVHQSLNWVAERQARYDDALDHAEQALALFEEVADQAGQAAALNAVGWCHVLLGDPERARPYCRRAVALNAERGTRRNEALAWDSLGCAEHKLGDLAGAVDCFQRALAIFREFGDRFYEAFILIHLGDAWHAAEDRRQANAAWQQALDILDDLHHPDAGQVRGKLGRPGCAGPG